MKCNMLRQPFRAKWGQQYYVLKYNLKYYFSNRTSLHAIEYVLIHNYLKINETDINVETSE